MAQVRIMPATGGMRMPMFGVLNQLVIAMMAFLTVVDLFATQAILPALALQYEVSPATMGAAANAATIGMAVAGLLAAMVSGRVDRRNVMVGSARRTRLPTAGLAFAPDLATFAALRVVQGALMATAFTLTLGHLGERCAVSASHAAFATYVTGNVACNLVGGIAFYLFAFIAASTLAGLIGESFTPIQILIRATGSLAMIMLTFVLAIRPLARLSPRFKPFLYNRRYVGVATFLIALAHAGFVILWYYGFSQVNPLVSLHISNPRYNSLAGFPFESLGLAALVVLFLMAATSHDFWNTNLGPGLWKALHMGVYIAYGLLVAHVALGAIQMERHPVYVWLLGAGAAVLAILHLWAGFAASGARRVATEAGWLAVGPPSDIADGCATVLQPAQGERIAVFRSGNLIHAVSNVCRHQGRPLGEGRIIDGCITCPWHGFQYRPEDGRSPPPFTERIATYPTRIRNGIVEVGLTPNPPGTPQPPSLIEGAAP